jgi:tetratricopeptide (TPR) repeat protein
MGGLTRDPLESRFRSELARVRQQIADGQLDSVRLDSELVTLTSELESSPELCNIARSFCADVLIQLQRDSMPFRAATLANLACRVAAWAGDAECMLTLAVCIRRLRELDDSQAALDLIERHGSIAQRVGTFERRLIEVLAATCLESLSRFEEADAHVARCEAAASILAGDHIALQLLLVGAVAASSMGNAATAERRSTEALALFERVSRMPQSPVVSMLLPGISAARVHAVRGAVMRQSGDPLRAIEAYQQAREHAKRDRDPRRAALLLSEIGITWERVAEFERASRLLNAAADEAEACGEPEMAARWRHKEVLDADGRSLRSGYNGLAYVVARLRATAGQPDDEAESIAKQIILEARGKDRQLETIARSVLAACYTYRQHFHQALAQTKVAIRIADDIGDRWLAMTFRSNEANMLFRANRFGEAEAVAQDAMERAMTFREQAPASEVRQAAAVGVASASEILFLLWGIPTIAPDGSIRAADADRVVELSQRVRSRNFDRWLALTHWTTGEDRPETQEAARELIAAEIAVEAASYSGAPVDAPLRDLAAATTRLHDVTGKQAGAKPPAHGNPTLAEAVECLRDGDLLLDLNAVESGIIAVVAGPGAKTQTFEIPWERGRRTQWMERWRALTHSPERRARVHGTSRPGASGIAIHADRLDERKEELIADLEEHFAKPASEHIGNSGRIICATHAELFGIPLWSLARRNPELVLSIVPSIASIRLLARRPASRATRNVKVGDATGTLEMVPFELERLRTFEPLAPDRSSLANGMAGVRRIHFAGHGDFIEANPYESGIVVRGEACDPYAVSTGDDGCVRLTLQGLIRDWRVAECELVVLSACSTGIPRAHAASEFTSVASTLLIAGARNVVAASWPADDTATALLMVAFHQSLQRRGSPSAALADARRTLQTMDRTSAVAALGDEELVPLGDRPFASVLYSDTFLHFGVS